ncbi:ABC transporter substrate-binding protein [Microbacterium aquimaris]|uniref:ABC transporter substrate-binding protein n=1 Tax=Microbacterium aquimaris TaxID=459816 RepID=A0ABU5N4E3_9MICO|nr:ABC transporter substrate-binding protein [Microbacterium aquimaris]MDZ8160944.1 ABC transporter substrate-binding protein [Microbacterium aquimaris]
MRLTSKTDRRLLAVGAIAAASALALAGCSGSGGGSDAGGGDGTLTIGVLAVGEGSLAFAMDESKRAIEVAMQQYGGDADGGTVGDTEVEFIYESTDGTSGTAQTKVKKLVENDDVDIVFGPVSGDEGEAVAQYALTVPEKTFVISAASPVGLTLEGADNLYRFFGDSAMWMGGVGTYAHDDKGYENIYLIAEDYSFPYDNAGGFFSEFCDAGGQITGSSWVPVGTTDYATIISTIPDETDAVYVGLGGADAASFLSQAVTAGVAKPLVGGTIAVDTTALSGDTNLASAAEGMISGGPVPGQDYDNPNWIEFSDAYTALPDAFPSPSIFAILPYNSIMPLLMGIETTGGDLGADQENLHEALSATDWNSPTGNITVDENNQGIVDNFIVEVQSDGGELVLNTISEAAGVTQDTVTYDRFDSCP